jgi:uncharacterized radical SAM superfamily Fe-S cluster-containing enzyme
MQDEIIRVTKSTCPVCLEDICAFIIKRENSVLLKKSCDKHGVFEILLSRRAELYKNLDELYFTIMDEEKKISEYEVWPTLQCDTECTICHLGSAKQDMKSPNPSKQDIEAFIERHNASSYVLSGGEPTCREDICEIIKIFKKHGKTITMHTNGLKLGSKDYLLKLKKSGLDRINLQFDGFSRDAYKIFRGSDLLDIKLKQLENLKQLDMPTDLNITVAKNVNENDVGNIIDFAVKNPFIKGVNFFTICLLGGIRDWDLTNYIMPDEVIDYVEDKCGYKITRRNVFLFQKLHLAMKSWQKERFCLYSQIYVLVRNNNSCEPIDKYLNLEKAEKCIDRYQRLYKKNRLLAKVVLMSTLPFYLFRRASLELIKEMMVTGLSYFFQTSHYLKRRRFLFINCSTACDPYKIDYGLIKNCQDGIVHMDTVSGKLEYKGCDGLHCIEMERKYHFNKKNSLSSEIIKCSELTQDIR